MVDPLSLTDPSGYASCEGDECATPDQSLSGGVGGQNSSGNVEKSDKGSNKQAGDHDSHAGSHIAGHLDGNESCSGHCTVTISGNGAPVKQQSGSSSVKDMQSGEQGSTSTQETHNASNPSQFGGGNIAFDADAKKLKNPAPCDTDDDCEIINRRVITVTGGTGNEQAAVHTALDKIESTPRGKELMEMQAAKGKILLIRIDDFQQQKASPLGHGPLTVNLDHIPSIYVVGGTMPVSITRTIAHEIGHAITGIDDDGRNNMHNVLVNENPIMTRLGEPARTRYELAIP